MKRIALLLAVLLVFTMAACTPEPQLTLGTYDGNSYSNEFFGLSFDVPESYTILSRSELNEAMGLMADFLSEETDMSEQAIKLAEEKTVFYSVAMAHPLDYTDGFNSNIVIQGENLSFLGKVIIADGREYLIHTKAQLEQAGIGYEFEEIETVQIGGTKHHKLPASIDYGFMVYQDMYATIINGHALTFIISYSDDAQKAAMMSIMDSVKFED